MSDSVYLSPAKLLLLVAIEQYSLHYDWGPTTLSDIADILVTYLCEPERQVDLEQLGRDMATISVPSELQQQPQSLQSILHYRISELTELEQFTQFFDSLRVLVVYAETQEAKDDEAILLDSESIFGIFVRRCVLAFEQLEFHQTGKFHNACIAATTAPKLKTSKPSQHELQDLVDHQIRLLENETGAAVPTDMASKIHGLIDALPGYAHAHYLDYLRLARTGEYEQSEASLRRFFDSSAMAQSKYGFQYALLYLAVLRTRLGLVAEAQQALDEALHTARDLQDHTCRVYVTIWQARLQYVKYKHGQSEPATVRASLEGLIASATNMQLREMRVAAHLNLVELLVDMGDTEGVFQELTLSWALIAENSIAEMRASWFLLAARAWTLAQNPAIALMYLSLAERDRHMMTGAQISGCQQLVSQLHRQVAENNHACAKSSQLVEAQRLIDTGRVNEAAEKLLEIIGGSDLESRQHALEMIKELDDGLLEQQQE